MVVVVEVVMVSRQAVVGASAAHDYSSGAFSLGRAFSMIVEFYGACV